MSRPAREHDGNCKQYTYTYLRVEMLCPQYRELEQQKHVLTHANPAVEAIATYTCQVRTGMGYAPKYCLHSP